MLVAGALDWVGARVWSRVSPRVYAAMLTALVAVLGTSCTERASGPAPAFALEDSQGLSADVMTGAPGEAIFPRIAFRAVDANGDPVSDATVRWEVVGTKARVSGTPRPAADGTVEATWTLGTDAREAQGLIVTVTRRDGVTASARLSALAVPCRVGGVIADSQRVTIKLGGSAVLTATAVDPYGNRFQSPDIVMTPRDSATAIFDSTGTLRGNSRGEGLVFVRLGTFADTISVQVIQVVARIDLDLDSLAFNAVGATRLVRARLVDDVGLMVTDSAPLVAIGDSTVATVADPDSILIRSSGPGTTSLSFSVGGVTRSIPLVVRQVVAAVQGSPGSVNLDALGDSIRIGAIAADSVGTEVRGAAIRFTSTVPAVATISETGLLRSVSNGTAAVMLSADNGAADTVSVVVNQVGVRVVPTTDSLVIDALQASDQIAATLHDRLGRVVEGAGFAYRSDVTAVASVDSTGLVRAEGAGSARVWILSDLDSAAVVVFVRQRAARVVIERTDTARIVLAAQGASAPVRCGAFDANGFPIAGASIEVLGTSREMFSGDRCEALSIRASGIDSVRIRMDGATAAMPIAVAVRPTASSPVGDALQLDSLPAGRWAPWAPTLRRNSRGDIELYLALYPFVGNDPVPGADVHRFVSTDGVLFRYDGVVLRHGERSCDPIGAGIENIFVLPRTDAPGWRMFFSGGSFECYGWQVFSAVSADERSWTIEPGVRVSNLNLLVAKPVDGSGWPVGEGMDIEQLSDGGWRMLVGGYEPRRPREERFQIVDWRSSDQLSWTYAGAALTTRQMPVGGQSSVYAPNVREIAPGLFRMIFSGDDREVAGGRGRVYSAVSTDKLSWQVEGALLDRSGLDFKYAAVLDDRLVTLRRSGPGPYELASVRVSAP